MTALIMVCARVEGIVYINGHFAGEARADAPIYRPIAPYGALYLEYRPLERGYLPLSRRLTFSAGRPVAKSVERAEGVKCVMWPGGVTEAELEPELCAFSPPECLTLSDAGREYRLIRTGERARLEIDAEDGTHALDLPDGAKPPVFSETDGRLYISGDTYAGERYALVLARDTLKPLITLTGGEVVFLGGGKLAATQYIAGVVRRARRALYEPSGDGYIQTESSILPPDAHAYDAASPLTLALACVEAKQLNLDAEARGCFAPGADMDESAARVCAETVSACAPRFHLPGGESAVCAMRAAGDRLLEAIPLYYRAETLGGAWRLTRLSDKAN